MPPSCGHSHRPPNSAISSGRSATTDTTPADRQIDACNKILALKVFTGDKLATIYFWRAVGWNKKGNYTQVIAGASEAIRLNPNVPSYNLRGSAYYDKGEYDIAIADFNDALRMAATGEVGIIYHNRGNALRSKGDYEKAIADYSESIKLGPPSAFSYQNGVASKQALGDIDGALKDINEAIRVDPTLPQPLTNRAVIWRAKGDLDRAIADTSEAIRLAKAKAPANIMKPRATMATPDRTTTQIWPASPLMTTARRTRPQQKCGCRRCPKLKRRALRPLRPPRRRRPQRPLLLRRRPAWATGDALRS